jgi:NAD(P)-dependent dehydrogenase (short-subunit alcohol dehydrogenase family)
VGRRIVRGLIDFGATVYNGDLSDGGAELREARHLELDIGKESSVAKGFADVIEESGRIDILINCAYPRTEDWGNRFEKVRFESWKRNINDHMGGYFLCCRQAAEDMKIHGGGSIINIASIYGVVAPDFSLYEETSMTMPAAYASIKAGIIAMTRYLASYYGPYNVRANCISPGGVLDKQAPAFVEKYCGKTFLGRMARPEDIVGAAIFLASDAASYVTGQNLIVDGGWTAA